MKCVHIIKCANVRPLFAKIKCVFARAEQLCFVCCWCADDSTHQKTCPPVVMPMCLGNCQFTHKKDADGCDVYDCVCSSYTSSPRPVCPPICDMYCQYGFQKDANGCAICQCKESPSCGVKLCELDCEFGLKRDSNGCQLCQCNQSPNFLISWCTYNYCQE